MTARHFRGPVCRQLDNLVLPLSKQHIQDLRKEIEERLATVQLIKQRNHEEVEGEKVVTIVNTRTLNAHIQVRAAEVIG